MAVFLGSSLGPSAQRLIRVEVASDVGEARRQAADLAAMLAFEPAAAGNLALGVTEAGMNIVKHAREGAMLLRAIHYGGLSAVEAMALDKGPGIANLAECMRDGYSTAGSPGTGLGALSRVTEAFEIVSHAGKGTALRFVLPSRAAPVRSGGAATTGAVCVAKADEAACGDGWCLLQDHASHTLLVVDGIGHGPEAAAAANTAIDLASRHGDGTHAAELIRTLHAGLRATRGAAAAAIVLDLAHARGTTCGVGNISVSVRHAGSTHRLVSHNGILGHRQPRMQEFPFPFPRERAPDRAQRRPGHALAPGGLSGAGAGAPGAHRRNLVP
jgi:anti-sigma regulatory factor (Ser/Thr protein kinase)